MDHTDLLIVLFGLTVFVVLVVIMQMRLSLFVSKPAMRGFGLSSKPKRLDYLIPLYKAALGIDSQKYYLRQFFCLDGVEQGAAPWNIPAGLLTIPWLLYRGMWLTAIMVAVVCLFIIFMTPIWLSMILMAIIMCLFGIYGNRYYYHLIRSDINSMLHSGLPDEIIEINLRLKWDFRVAKRYLIMGSLFVMVGTIDYLYDFEKPDLSQALSLLPNHPSAPVAAVEPPPPIPSHPGEDFKNLIMHAMHKESFAFLLMTKIKAVKDRESQTTLLKELTASATAGNRVAQHALGMIYSNGYLGVPKDHAPAMEWYKKAAENGHTGSQIQLSMLHSSGEGAAGISTDPLPWLALAARAGSVIAQSWRTPAPPGPHNSKAYDREIRNLIQRASDGETKARQVLLQKVRQETNRQKQNALFMNLVRAAQDGNVMGQYTLGWAYENGYMGVPQNLGAAMEWYSLSASNGGKDSETRLGAIYSAEPEYQAAVASVERSAAKPLAPGISAEDNDKRLWLKRIKTAKSPVQQARLLAKLQQDSATGKLASEYLLGVIHEHGYLGTTANRETALKHYQSSAKEGYLDAQVALGRLYSSGAKAQQNLQEAEYWLKEAESQGSATAKALLSSLYFINR